MLELILNDIGSTDFDICLFDRPTIPTPERDVESVPIRGRNGSLTKKYAWLDMTMTVTLNMISDGLKPDIRMIKPWLLNATKLQLSDDDVYYDVLNVSVGDIENEMAEYGVFDVMFTLRPFQYQDKASTTLTAPGTIYNPGTETALPYIKVTGSGSITLDINGRDLSMTLTDYVEIDSELGYAFRGTEPADNLINGEPPILTVGNNLISWTGTVTSVEVKYRAVFV